jgi:electron transfer flavoprotein alpha subunit
MTILILVEHDNTAFKPGTLQTVAAAQKLGGDIHALVAGSNSGAAASAMATVPGIAKVLHADDAAYAHPLAENLALLVQKTVQSGGYTHILAASTSFGKNVLPRAAALLDLQPISDVSAILSADTFTRPIYAGNAFATVQSLDTIKCLTIRPTAFDAVPATGGAAPIETILSAGDSGLTRFVSQELSKSERPTLSAARIVVSGGRGLGSAENFKTLLEPFADSLGAALGASRAAVDAGYVPNDYQVGQTGQVVAPELYIAIGISGAIQHLAGMKDSKVIVAINKDADAPIFGVADYGLVGDLFTLLPELRAALGK